MAKHLGQPTNRTSVSGFLTMHDNFSAENVFIECYQVSLNIQYVSTGNVSSTRNVLTPCSSPRLKCHLLNPSSILNAPIILFQSPCSFSSLHLSKFVINYSLNQQSFSNVCRIHKERNHICCVYHWKPSTLQNTCHLQTICKCLSVKE